MCDRSILVLISSSPRNVRAERGDEVCASAEPRMWARTFCASCSSSELEWVFFSVTPTIGRASRMALLLTSSSLARSLIRTLLIRPFWCPALRLGLHCILTESASGTRTPLKMRRVPWLLGITIQFFPERSRLPARALRFRFRPRRLGLALSPQEALHFLQQQLRLLAFRRQLPAPPPRPLQEPHLRWRLPRGLQSNYSPPGRRLPP